MAKYNGFISFGQLKKAIGKQVAVKQYAHAIVITKFPDMRHVKPSKEQKAKRQKFKEAVAYAQNIVNNPQLKTAYLQKLKPKQTVYHFALKEYLQRQ
ncbi:hypothetical protein GALL_251590 [mine drainage metagenome]|uniref:Uncharacterized protein n=1 Tax=mine drainage metagenome TaxID=410659 RepID=A0A1J5R9Y2_9ZZZZ